MVSFIIIGRNQGKTLQLAFRSVLLAAENIELDKFEIIYVDTKSNDDSINVAKGFKQVRIYQTIDPSNAAIARNIGALEAIGDILCFIDGDMEINQDFLNTVFINNKLCYPFISGELRNIYYDNKGQKISENITPLNLKGDKFYSTTGGYFLINRDLWQRVSGMNTKYRRCQDIDMGLRLAHIGAFLLRKKVLFGNHHTIHYQNNSRMWKMLFDGSLIYGTSILYRDHIFNKHIYPIIIRKSYTLLLLITCLLLMPISPFFFCFYFVVQLVRSYYHDQKSRVANIFSKLLYFILLDLFSIWGFFFFFPNKKNISYITIGNKY